MPRIWLISDARLGEALWPALRGLPRGAGVVFRHDEAPDRLALGRRVAAVARARGLVMIAAGDAAFARRLRCHGLHRRESMMRPGWPRLRGGTGAPAPPGGWRTASAHGVAALVAARRAGARLAFVGPVHATASHPGARSLGRVRLGLMLRAARVARLGPAIAALGGMNARRARALRPLGVCGWGAIDALAPPTSG